MTPKKSQKKDRIVFSRCRALIPLDTGKIRAAELRKLQRQKKACAALSAELERFEQEEKRAYGQWFQTHCGPALAEYRAIEKELSLMQEKLDLIHALLAFYPYRSGQDCVEAAEAYYQSEGTIPAGFESFFNPPKPPEAEGAAENDEEFDDDVLGDEERLHAFFDAMFEQFSSPKEPGPGHLERHRKEQQTIKEIYRRIARRLHPDGGPDAAPPASSNSGMRHRRPMSRTILRRWSASKPGVNWPKPKAATRPRSLPFKKASPTTKTSAPASGPPSATPNGCPNGAF